MPVHVSSSQLRTLAFAVASGVLVTTGMAATATAEHPLGQPSDSPPGKADDPEALAVLQRAVTAERDTPYVGRQFVAVWSDDGRDSELLEITNVPGQGTAVRVNRGSDRESAAFFTRYGTETAIAGPPPNRLAESYQVGLAGRASSAGRPATVVEAARADGSLAARFWIDRATGLLLRRELYAPDGTVQRASAFVDIRVEPEIFLAHLPPRLAGDGGETVSAASYAGLSRDGWTCCVPELAGSLRLSDVRRVDGGSTLQLTYTDGLTSASLFEQRGRLDGSSLAHFTERRVGDGVVQVRYGLSSYAVWSSGGTVYTAVCDTPRGLDALVEAFPPEARAGSDDGLGQRLDRGMTRMVSWLNPFG